MGKIYAFQSPLHGQCGTTASMVAAAYAMTPEGCTAVLVHSQSNFADLENLFHTRTEKRAIYDGIGLDSLCYTIKARDLQRQDLERAVLQIDTNMYLLPSAAKRTDSERENILKYIITEKLPMHYDYVFVDVGSTSGYSEISEAIREAADKNIIVIAQNKGVLPKPEDIKKGAVLLCGNYEKERKLNLAALRQMYPKHKVYAIPRCPEFGDAISDSNVHRFFHVHEKLLNSIDSDTGKKFSIKPFKKSEDATSYFFEELLVLRRQAEVERKKERSKTTVFEQETSDMVKEPMEEENNND